MSKKRERRRASAAKWPHGQGSYDLLRGVRRERAVALAWECFSEGCPSCGRSWGLHQYRLGGLLGVRAPLTFLVALMYVEYRYWECVGFNEQHARAVKDQDV